MTKIRQSRLVDPLIAVSLALAYVAWLLASVKTIGYARDEGFYFGAAASYERWFVLLGESPKAALARAAVDSAWSANHEHPALMKSLFALSHHFLYEKLHWLPDAGTAYRFPGMVVSSLAISTTYLWGARTLGRSAGVVAACLLGLMPRVFHHSHLDCFDMPVAAMWLITTYAYWRSIEKGGWFWPIATGVLYGLLLDTKHNAWLFPGVLLAHFVLWKGRGLWRELRRGRVSVPMAFLAIVTISPVVFYLTWPWIWFDTGKRLSEWFAFHVGHEYYNMEFLGQTYWKPPMPRLYAWVMTVATVPGITLLLFGIGFVERVPSMLAPRFVDRWVLPRGAPPSDALVRATDLLWALGIIVSYAPWLSTNTPIFGGTKHWLTAYPFLCLFAARGFVLVSERVREWLPERMRRFEWQKFAILVCVLIGPAIMTARSTPWGLSFYSPIVGGATGAASLGLNRSFWGYTTGAIAPYLNAHAPPNSVVYVHDTALQSWDMMQRDGRIRSDLRGSLDIATSSAALYHDEAHMARVEQEVWIAYGTVRPATVGVQDGVPVVWLYLRP